MILVRQEHSEGCLIACLAMVSDKTYADVFAMFTRHDPTESGLNEYQVQDFLSQHGFSFQIINKYSWMGEDKRRGVWPAPLSAELTICRVDGGRGGEWSHGIVVTRDGVAYDPVHGVREWSEYDRVGSMMPLFRHPRCADAALIAAAPEMLDAMKRVLDILRDKGAPGWGVAKDILGEAIVKAEGRVQ